MACHDYPVMENGVQVGRITSGTLGPTVQEPSEWHTCRRDSRKSERR